MTLYEFNVTVRGYSKINTGRPEPMSEKAFEAGLERIRALNLPDVKV
jgi:hypothetical protein